MAVIIAGKLDLRGEEFILRAPRCLYLDRNRRVVTNADCWDLRPCHQRTDPVHLALSAFNSRENVITALARIGAALK
jgi:hypothetical protein